MSGARNEMIQKNTTATLFIDKDSWIRHLHPFTKLSYVLLTGVTVYTGLFDWKCTCLLLLVNAVVAASGGILKEVCQALGRIILPLLLFMIPIHGFLYPGNKTILFEAYNMPLYQDGLLFALTTLSKLTALLMTSLLFVFSTHPADLITAISHQGKSPSLAYLIGSPLLLLGGMRERIETIQAAQRARGLHTDGNVIQRFCSLAPLILPLVIGAIVEVEQRSIALEVRGFKSTSIKTSLRILTDSTLQRLARWLMLSVAAALVLFRWCW
ncbi:MAG: energy-coupling factor transport system permease protein [Desulforhopalus sp.]|jgi:energy-coupling factor transport system permease protein